MIKVNIKTQETSREPIPECLRNLGSETLRNLQTELNPVPPHLIDIEFWPENRIVVEYDQNTQKLEGETFELNTVDKIVNATPIVVDRFDTPEELQAFLDAESLKAFESFKKEKQAEMESAWDAGVVTSIDGIHMQAGQVDQDKIAAGLVSQQNKINIGKATLFDTVTVRDINNVNHTVTIQDFMVIVADVAEYVENLQYGYWAAVDGWTGEEI